MSKAKLTATVSQVRMYDLIRSPVVTEKSTLGTQHNQVTFRVPLDASKPEIKAAVEGVFKVKVKAVNTLRLEGKTKRFRGRLKIDATFCPTDIEDLFSTVDWEVRSSQIKATRS